MNSKTPIKNRVIVSLTSFPEAIPFAIQAVKSVLEGSVAPHKVVLYLTASQFPEEKIPMMLQELTMNPTFEVRFYEENIRSYTKLIPALKDFLNDIIVTIDDDVMYGRNMLQKLLKVHKKHPETIIGHRVRHLKLDAPYCEWKRYKEHRYITKSMKPRFTNLQTGVGGVLYPPNALQVSMLDSGLFMKMAPTVDDIWLWAAAVANGTKIAPVPFGDYKLNDLGKPKEISLFNTNGKKDNDVNRTVLEKILEKYPEIRQRINDEIDTDMRKNLFLKLKRCFN